jgi:hypothetical protein
VPLQTYEQFASRDPLSALVLEQMLAGVSTRRLARTREPVGEQVTAVERSASKSANSRAFIARAQESLDALMGRRLDDVRLAVLMLDGIDLKGRTNSRSALLGSDISPRRGSGGWASRAG